MPVDSTEMRRPPEPREADADTQPKRSPGYVDGETDGEARSYPPDRYSPSRLSVLLHLPESNARSFIIASALGNILDAAGTRNSLRSAKDATGVLITKKRRDTIIGHLGITRNSPEGAVFHGYDGLAEGLRLWLDMWKDFELEVTEVIDVGPNKVVVGSRQRGRGRGSQVPSESEVYWVDTIEDGKIVRFDVCPDKETALETAGAGG